MNDRIARRPARLLALAGLILVSVACSAAEPKSTTVGASASAATSSGGDRQDLRAFVARRQQCDHFRGEEGSTPKRQAEIDAALTKFCTGTDAELKALKKKYRADKAASKTLAGFDANIE